jgi:hypothetical protein
VTAYTEEKLGEIVKFVRQNPAMKKMVVREIVEGTRQGLHEHVQFFWRVLDRIVDLLDEFDVKLLAMELAGLALEQ